MLALNFHKEGLSYIKNGAGFLQLNEMEEIALMKRIEISSEKSPNFIVVGLFKKTISKRIIDFFEDNKTLQKKGSQQKELKKTEKINRYYDKSK